MIRIRGVRASRNVAGQLSNAFFANAPVEQTVNLPPVVLTVAFSDEPQALRINHDHLGSQLLQKAAHPRRVCSAFDSDPHFLLAHEY
jgi:hypothetical protein